MKYTENNLKTIYFEYRRIHTVLSKMVNNIVYFPYKNEKAKEYANDGFSRRLFTMIACIENIFEQYPPNSKDKEIDDKLNINIIINLQAFIFNLYGAIDNLAWIYVYEKQITYKNNNKLLVRRDIGLSRKYKELRCNFSPQFQEILESNESWFIYLNGYRHSLAHGIPLTLSRIVYEEDKEEYVGLNVELQNALDRLDFESCNLIYSKIYHLHKFSPLMINSLNENDPIHYHVQILTDWNTLSDISKKIKNELEI